LLDLVTIFNGIGLKVIVAEFETWRDTAAELVYYVGYIFIRVMSLYDL